jgi:hypothetical protein
MPDLPQTPLDRPAPSHPMRALILGGAALAIVLIVAGVLTSGPSTASAPSSASAASTADVPTAAGPTALGSTYTYPDGLAVTVTVGDAFTPDGPAAGPARGLTLLVTVHNGTPTAFPLDWSVSGPRVLVDGAPATIAVDMNGPAPLLSATLTPDETVRYPTSVLEPTGPARLHVEWSRSLDPRDGPVAVFTGTG